MTASFQSMNFPKVLILVVDSVVRSSLRIALEKTKSLILETHVEEIINVRPALSVMSFSFRSTRCQTNLRSNREFTILGRWKRYDAELEFIWTNLLDALLDKDDPERFKMALTFFYWVIFAPFYILKIVYTALFEIMLGGLIW